MHFSELLRRLALQCSMQSLLPASTTLARVLQLLLHSKLQEYNRTLEQMTPVLDQCHHLELVWHDDAPSRAHADLVTRCRSAETAPMAACDVPAYTAYAQTAADATLTSLAAGAQVKRLHDLVMHTFQSTLWASSNGRQQARTVAHALTETTAKLHSLAKQLQDHIDRWRWENDAAAGSRTGGDGGDGDRAARDGAGGALSAGDRGTVVALSEEGLNEPSEEERARPFDYFEAEALGQSRRRPVRKHHQRRRDDSDDDDDDDDDDDGLTEAERTAKWRAEKDERMRRYAQEREQERLRQQQQQTTEQLLSELSSVLQTLPKR